MEMESMKRRAAAHLWWRAQDLAWNVCARRRRRAKELVRASQSWRPTCVDLCVATTWPQLRGDYSGLSHSCGYWMWPKAAPCRSGTRTSPSQPSSGPAPFSDAAPFAPMQINNTSILREWRTIFKFEINSNLSILEIKTMFQHRYQI